MRPRRLGASAALLLAVVVAALLPPAAHAWVSPGRGATCGEAVAPRRRCLAASAATPSTHGWRRRHGGVAFDGVGGIGGRVGISDVGAPIGADAGRWRGASRGPTSRSQVATNAVSKQGFDQPSNQAYDIPGAPPV